MNYSLIATGNGYEVRQYPGSLGYRVYFGETFVSFYVDLANAMAWLKKGE